jgi:hypothetical protein
VTGQTEDGRPVLSDGSTVVQDNGDGTYTTDTGSIIDDQGNILQPGDPNAMPQAGPAEGEIDPTTGLPVDPNAAEAGAQPPADEKSGPPIGKLLLGGAVGIGAIWGLNKWRKAKFAPKPAVEPPNGGGAAEPAKPAQPRGAGAAEPAARAKTGPERIAERVRSGEAPHLKPATAAPHTGSVQTPAARPKPTRITLNGKPLFEPSSGPFRRGASRAAGAPGADIPILKRINPAVVERDAQAAARAFAQNAVRNKVSAAVGDATRGAVQQAVEHDAGKVLSRIIK